jgi:hypothetical protein
MRNRLFAAILPVFLLSTAAVHAADFVAGLTPDRRPEAAPRITEFQRTPEWEARALRGIAQPATGTGFLQDQGAWHTPFIHPNMPGRYDIRGLHRAQARPALRKD